MNHKTHYNLLIALVFSVLLHSGLLSFYFLQTNHAGDYKIAAEKQIIETQLIKAINPSIQTIVTQAQKTFAHKTPQKIVVTKKENLLPHAPIKTISGKETNALVTLLYHAINQHKVYPDMAYELQQQGQVNVSFRLLPDGSITQLQVTQSSRYDSLDQAALQAIRDALPFVGVNRLIHQEEVIYLTIGFQIN